MKYGLRAFGVEVSVEEMNALLKFFDQSRTGKLSLNEMLHAMRSNSMNDTRSKIVTAAYNKLDKRGNQCVTIGDLHDNYDCNPNPEYQGGLKSA